LGAEIGLALKHTALNALHKAAGARMVEFGGWEMPVEYSGIVQEHLAVRTCAGLFDVSHMGEIEVRGPQALDLVQYVTSNDASRLETGQAQYSAIMQPLGSAVDDCIVHRLASEHFLLCVNAANTEKDFAWIVGQNSFSGAEVRDVSSDYSQLALQGPLAARILSRLTPADLTSLKYYWFTCATCCGLPMLIARTGYTGEDGFELYFAPAESQRVWDALLDAGKDDSLVPAGLGARNTLRLEAAYPLYGHELDDETTLLEANLGWICKLDKGEFLGREALEAQKQHGSSKKLIGFEITGRGIARDGNPIVIDGLPSGRVTSGSYAPYLKKSIGLGYVAAEATRPRSDIHIEIRGKAVPARVVALPFYKRPK
jgi:aminomethyltransferase